VAARASNGIQLFNMAYVSAVNCIGPTASVATYMI
jgi:hypothetical protein